MDDFGQDVLKLRAVDGDEAIGADVITVVVELNHPYLSLQRSARYGAGRGVEEDARNRRVVPTASWNPVVPLKPAENLGFFVLDFSRM